MSAPRRWLPPWASLVVTTAFLATTLAIALTVHELGIVFTVIDSCGDLSLSFLMPSVFYLRIVSDGPLTPLAYLQLVVGLCIFTSAMVMIALGVTL